MDDCAGRCQNGRQVREEGQEGEGGGWRREIQAVKNKYETR